MKFSPLGRLAVAAAFLLAGFPSHAGSADPTAPAQSGHAGHGRVPEQAPLAKINQAVPPFEVRSFAGTGVSLRSFRGLMPLFVIADIHCPCVQAVEGRIRELDRKYWSSGLRVVYVFSHPQQGSVEVKQFLAGRKYPWISVEDRDQKVLKLLDGRCASEVYLLDTGGVLRYHGRVDDSQFDPKAVKSRDLENAITALLENREVPKTEVPASGCSIPRL